jgi:hypothetical protein
MQMNIRHFLIVCCIPTILAAELPSVQLQEVLPEIYGRVPNEDMKRFLENGYPAYVLSFNDKEPFLYDLKTEKLTATKLNIDEFFEHFDLPSNARSAEARWLLLKIGWNSTDEFHDYYLDLGRNFCHGYSGGVRKNRVDGTFGRFGLRVKCCL